MAKAKTKLLYKVLVNGRSCHGGTFEWSLPSKGKPGKWHSIKSKVQVCSIGFHLTDDPTKWFDKKNAVIYVAEGSGKSETLEDKTAFEKARLIRKLSDAELAGLQIFKTGTHTVIGGTAVALDNSHVEALGDCTVTARDNSTVEARDNSTVEARDNSTVTALGNSHVEARDNSTVTALDNSTVTALDNSTVNVFNNIKNHTHKNQAVLIDRTNNLIFSKLKTP